MRVCTSRCNIHQRQPRRLARRSHSLPCRTQLRRHPSRLSPTAQRRRSLESHRCRECRDSLRHTRESATRRGAQSGLVSHSVWLGGDGSVCAPCVCSVCVLRVCALCVCMRACVCSRCSRSSPCCAYCCPCCAAEAMCGCVRMYTCVRLLCDCVCVLLCLCVAAAAVKNLDPQPWAPWPYKWKIR